MIRGGMLVVVLWLLAAVIVVTPFPLAHRPRSRSPISSSSSRSSSKRDVPQQIPRSTRSLNTGGNNGSSTGEGRNLAGDLPFFPQTVNELAQGNNQQILCHQSQTSR